MEQKLEKPKKDAKARSWVFTHFNYEHGDVEKILRGFKCKYIVWGREVCPTTGKKHLQGYIWCTSPRTFNGMMKEFKFCYLNVAVGSYRENYAYCTKGGDFYEDGEPPAQGQRTDIITMKKKLLVEKVPIYEIIEQAESYQEMRSAELLTKYVKPEMRLNQKVIWIYGDAGAGKTRYVYDNHDHNLIYKWNNDKWFDGYDMHPIVILDDIRPGDIEFSKLLTLLDIYPHRVPVKGSFRVFKPTHIYITNIQKPEDIFTRADEPFEQLSRRIHEIIKVEFCPPRNGGTEVQ